MPVTCHVPVTIGLTQIMRPVCLTSEANNSMLSQVLAWIENAIIKIADKDVVLCSSTEEMVTSLKAVNSDTIKAEILTEFFWAMKISGAMATQRSSSWI